jgi:hypothetical protein
VFTDYLAIAGGTSDHKVTGLKSGLMYPYLAVTSIDIPDKYYWAKVLSLYPGATFSGLKFSNDGALLIAHSYNSANQECIVAFNAGSGVVLSARSYSSYALINYNKLIKSILISSGPSPMSYILSNHRDDTNPS